MKTLVSLLLPIASGALLALPFNLEIAGSIIFALGFLWIVRADYGRRTGRPLTTAALTKASAKKPESYRLAA